MAHCRRHWHDPVLPSANVADRSIVAKHPAQRPAMRRQPRSARPGRQADRLPETIVVQVTGTDPDGDARARPVSWE